MTRKLKNACTLARTRRRALAVLRVLPLLAAGAFAAAMLAPFQAVMAQTPPAPDRVAGHVVQGTGDAEVPAGLEVTLRVIDAQGSLVDERTETIDADGTFSFADLPNQADNRYQLVVVYGNIRRTVAVEDALNPENIDLYVYEPTDALDDVTVLTHAIIIPRVDGRSRVMGVLELVELSNIGDRTFVPNISGSSAGMPQVVLFALPKGFQELSIESDLPTGSVLETELGFALTNAVPPGEFSIMFSYAVEYDGDSFEFARTMTLGAREVRILMPPSAGIVSGDGLSPQEDAQLGETSYRVLRGLDYPRDERMTIRFSQLPQPSFIETIANFTGRSAWTTIGVPTVAAAAMAGLLAYVFLFRKHRRDAFGTISPGQRRRLVSEIAALDNRYESGEVDDDEYDRLRDALVGKALSAVDEHAGEETGSTKIEITPAREQDTGGDQPATEDATGEERRPIGEGSQAVADSGGEDDIRRDRG